MSAPQRGSEPGRGPSSARKKGAAESEAKRKSKALVNISFPSRPQERVVVVRFKEGIGRLREDLEYRLLRPMAKVGQSAAPRAQAARAKVSLRKTSEGSDRGDILTRTNIAAGKALPFLVAECALKIGGT